MVNGAISSERVKLETKTITKTLHYYTFFPSQKMLLILFAEIRK